jgi:ribonucleoside-diphosphate reductase alpha chain
VELPARRRTVRQKLTIGTHRVYVDVGLSAEGRPGELFLVVEQTGSERRWLFDEVARLASKLVQHGCPLAEIAEGWRGTKGTICGPVQHYDQIKFATSVLDAVGQYLQIEYGQEAP